MADPGEGHGGFAPSLFLHQTEARGAEKKFSETAPSLSQGLDDPPPPKLSEGLDPPLSMAAVSSRK